jgi:predicted DNA-binding transcriptional regulator AlpA
MSINGDYVMRDEPKLRRFLRVPEVEAAVGKKKSWLYIAAREGTFPKPFKAGGTTVWDEAEIAEWQEAQRAKRAEVTA